MVVGLRVHLAGRRGRAPVTLDALAAATGRSKRALAWALPELRPEVTPRADPVLPGHVRRTVCWHCAARRDVFSYATAWQPAEACICPDHRIWLGSAAHPRQPGQYDVAGLPEILQAQQRHYRLARRHGRQQAIDAVAEAAHMMGAGCSSWRGTWRSRRSAVGRRWCGRSPCDVTALLRRVFIAARFKAPGPDQPTCEEIHAIRLTWEDAAA